MRCVFVAAAIVVVVLTTAGASVAQEPRHESLSIPAGRYQSFFRVNGQRRETPVRPFRIDATPVSRAEFAAFVRSNPEWRRSHVKALLAEDNYLANWSDDLDSGDRAPDDPVTFVSWFAARAYCAAQGMRLPTIAEWERVAGTSARTAANAPGSPVEPFRFAMGHVAADLTDRPLDFGGVWEWNADFNSAVVNGAAESRRGGSSSSLFCGDGYRATDASDYAAFLRYSFRSSLKANYALKNLGFRCAQDMQ